MYRKWLREELDLEAYAPLYISAVARAARFNRLKAAVEGTKAADRIRRAELKGRTDAYMDVAVMAVSMSHGLDLEAAERIAKEHRKRWAEATLEDEQRDAEAC